MNYKKESLINYLNSLLCGSKMLVSYFDSKILAERFVVVLVWGVWEDDESNEFVICSTDSIEFWRGSVEAVVNIEALEDDPVCFCFAWLFSSSSKKDSIPVGDGLLRLGTALLIFSNVGVFLEFIVTIVVSTSVSEDVCWWWLWVVGCIWSVVLSCSEIVIKLKNR